MVCLNYQNSNNSITLHYPNNLNKGQGKESIKLINRTLNTAILRFNLPNLN